MKRLFLFLGSVLLLTSCDIISGKEDNNLTSGPRHYSIIALRHDGKELFTGSFNVELHRYDKEYLPKTFYFDGERDLMEPATQTLSKEHFGKGEVFGIILDLDSCGSECDSEIIIAWGIDSIHDDMLLKADFTSGKKTDFEGKVLYHDGPCTRGCWNEIGTFEAKIAN